jgi:methionyl-tRNA formyltransferase
MTKLKIVFLGTPAFSVPTLMAVHQSELADLALVISMPDRPSGRGQQLSSPEVIQYAKTHSIPYAQSENINKDESLIDHVRSLQPDIILVLAFAQFLNKTWLNLATIGVYNIHTSLLPKYRGAAPIQAAILNGDTLTGVTIQKMVHKMDAGDIVHSSVVELNPTTNAQELAHLLQEKAAEATLDFFKNIQSNTISYTPQDESQVSYAPTIKKEDGYIDFLVESSVSIFRKHLAYHPWPGTYFFLNNKRIKLIKIEPSSQTITPSQLSINEHILVGCPEGSIRILEAQPEGKRSLETSAFRQWLQAQKSGLIITRLK